MEITSIETHPDGNLLAIGCSNGSTKLWSITGNEILTSLEDNITSPIDLMDFSENGYLLAVGSRSGKVVKIFDLRKAKCVQTLFTETPISITAL